VAVICQLLAQGFAVGKDEIVVDICYHYENSCVVRTIVINTIVNGSRREVLSQIVQFYLGLLVL
jgi:hypothetical protein